MILFWAMTIYGDANFLHTYKIFIIFFISLCIKGAKAGVMKIYTSHKIEYCIPRTDFTQILVSPCEMRFPISAYVAHVIGRG